MEGFEDGFENRPGGGAGNGSGTRYWKTFDVWLASRLRVRAGSSEEAEAVAVGWLATSLEASPHPREMGVEVSGPPALLSEAAVLALGLLRLEREGGEGAGQVARLRELLLRPEPPPAFTGGP